MPKILNLKLAQYEEGYYYDAALGSGTEYIRKDESERILNNNQKAFEGVLKEKDEIIENLKQALCGLIGSSDKDELLKMAELIKGFSEPANERMACINAINVLLSLKST